MCITLNVRLLDGIPAVVKAVILNDAAFAVRADHGQPNHQRHHDGEPDEKSLPVFRHRHHPGWKPVP
jgi:hypothetical protein